jgi:hypothetical protein
MSGCVLRVDASDDVDIEAVVAGFPLKPLAVFRKGALPRPMAKRVSTSNGFNVEVSNHDGMHLAEQVADAEGFLERNRDALSLLSTTPGITSLSLDFGTDFDDEDVARTHRLPWSVLQLCAALEISIDISVYRTSASE